MIFNIKVQRKKHNTSSGVSFLTLCLLVSMPASDVLARDTATQDNQYKNLETNLRAGRVRKLSYQHLNCGDLVDCEFQGKDRYYLGDGYCDLDGCYNSEACGWDHGDCCQDTCGQWPGQFGNTAYDCGFNGYHCENPTHRTNPSSFGRNEAIVQQILTVSEQSDLDTADSAQEGAAYFITTFDTMALDADNEKFLQRYIMAVFYFGISNYGNLYVARDECDWPGVTCNGNNKITKISLSGHQITGTIPSEIFKITTLSELDISNNTLDGNLPGGLNGLNSSLTILNLSNNNLSGDIPDDFYASLTALETLNLNNNNFGSNMPRNVCDRISELIYPCNLCIDCGCSNC